jgi:maltose alpha-D-glucosyltransferase/alpha-amylase
MRVCLDLVAGHTSTDHPWFQASARPEKNKYSNWFIWTDNGWNDPGAPLTAIRGVYDRDGAFVVNFFAHQPALNFGFANPDPKKPWQLPVTHPDVQAVRREMMKIMRFWLDLGADGFRVDMASSLVKGDTDFRETMAFWRDVRKVYDRDYPEAVLIAEWSNPALAIAAGFHIDFLIHFNVMVYTTLFRNERSRDVFHTRTEQDYGRSFFDRSGGGDIRRFLDVYMEHYEPTRETGFISVPTGNHDIGRLATGPACGRWRGCRRRRAVSGARARALRCNGTRVRTRDSRRPRRRSFTCRSTRRKTGQQWRGRSATRNRC